MLRITPVKPFSFLLTHIYDKFLPTHCSSLRFSLSNYSFNTVVETEGYAIFGVTLLAFQCELTACFITSIRIIYVLMSEKAN